MLFLIWPHGIDELMEFQHQLNSMHPTINLTLEYSKDSMDTQITLADDNIVTSVHRKPTDNLTFLNYGSFHPTHMKQSIQYSQPLRCHRICSDPVNPDTHLNILRDAHVRCGYSAHLVDSVPSRY